MKCLVCENVKLERKTLCDELDGFVCDQCSGVWIQAKAYLENRLTMHPDSQHIDFLLFASVPLVRSV